MAGTEDIEFLEGYPADFLEAPAKNITVEPVNFTKAGLREYEGLYAVVIDNALSPDECQTLFDAAEAQTSGQWERAQINIGGGRQATFVDQRNCGRSIWDSKDMVARIWKRIEHAVPEIQRLEKQAKVTGNGPVKRGEVWKLTRLNERMRFLKYEGGEYFRGR